MPFNMPMSDFCGSNSIIQFAPQKHSMSLSKLVEVPKNCLQLNLRVRFFPFREQPPLCIQEQNKSTEFNKYY